MRKIQVAGLKQAHKFSCRSSLFSLAADRTIILKGTENDEGEGHSEHGGKEPGKPCGPASCT